MGITTPSPLNLQATLSSLPPPPFSPCDLRQRTRKLLKSQDSNVPILVALDDDPTGTQTCHNISVLTVWDITTLSSEFTRTPRGSGFFILTNSRALHPPQARNLIAEICRNLQWAAERVGVSFE